MSALLFVVGVLVIVLGVGASIALHELGHLLPAKRFGVKVPQYMIGFGPTLWSRRVGETEVGIKAIPMGGYVRMIGMFPPAPGASEATLRKSSTGRFSQLIDQARSESMEEVAPGDENRVFYKLPVHRKVITMLGGPLMNLLIGTLIIGGVVTVYGTPEVTTRIETIGTCVPSTAPTLAAPNPACKAGDPSSPAAAAGLKPGDTITAVNGAAVSTWSQITATIHESAGKPVVFSVTRADGSTADLTITPVRLSRAQYDEATGKPKTNTDGTLQLATVGFAGITPTAMAVRQPVTAVPGAVGGQLATMAGVIVRLPEKLVGVAQAAFGSGERDPNGPISVIGVGRAGGEIASVGFSPSGNPVATVMVLLQLIGGLNLALFMFNLIPLLPLDGGHVIGALWEGVKRQWARLRRLPDPGYVDVAKALPVAYSVSIALVAMSALLIYADLVRPISIFG